MKNGKNKKKASIFLQMCTKMLKSWTFSGSTLAGSCCCCHRTNKGKVFPSSALIANAIYISESLYHCGLNFARYVILSSGSGRVIGCILQQTHSFRDPSLAVVGLTERSTRLVQCYCWLKKEHPRWLAGDEAVAAMDSTINRLLRTIKEEALAG